jgi:hypothetical protein
MANQDCNEVVMDSLAGTCFAGYCICRAGMYNQPDGRCGPTAPPDCKTQGGTCHQNPATCPAFTTGADQGTDMSCGDLVAAVCCFDTCKGSLDLANLVCCGPTGAADPPICENGWLTCKPADAPVGKSQCG